MGLQLWLGWDWGACRHHSEGHGNLGLGIEGLKKSLSVLPPARHSKDLAAAAPSCWPWAACEVCALSLCFRHWKKCLWPS